MSTWIDQMLQAEIVKREGIVRRNIGDVSKYASHQELLAEVRNRGYHLIQTGDQYVVICNPGAIQLWC